MKRQWWDDLRQDWPVLLFVSICYTLLLATLAAWWVLR